MKVLLATLGGFVLQLAAMILVVLIVAAALLVLVPAALPTIGFAWYNAVGVSGLLFLVKAIFK